MIYNTGETEKDLRAKHNPDGSVLRKAQLRMLDMLIYIDRVCKEQNIEYCLDGGNVLGAIRHGGFIPWDDDVDIILRREEYDRLCKYLLENPHPQYVLQTPETDSYFANHWNILRDIKSEYIQDSKVHKLRKFRGMQIDIFPLDSNVIHSLHSAINYFHWRITDSVLIRFPKAGVLLYKLEKCFSVPVARFISKFIVTGNKNKYTYGYGLPWYKIFDKDIVFPTKNIEFENHTFSGPNNPEEYLRILYGNYMELPSIDNRNHHKADYKIYD